MMPDRGRAPAFARLPKTRHALVAILLAIHLLSLFFLFPQSFGPRVVLEPWILASGYRLYVDLVDQHEPLLPVALSYAVRAGLEPLTAARLAFAAIQAAALLLLYAATLRLTARPQAALLASLFYVLAAPGILQGKLWFDMAMGPVLAAAVIPMLSKDTPRNAYLTGLLLGVAFLVKQHALFVLVAVLAWMLLHQPRRPALQRAVRCALGFAALPMCHILWRISTGSLDDYLHWCWGINDRYLQMAARWLPSQHALEYTLIGLVALYSAPLWLRERQWRLIAMAAIGASVLAFPRYAAFHLAAALPFIAMLAAGPCDAFVRSWSSGEPCLTMGWFSRVGNAASFAGLFILAALPWLNAGRNVRVEEYDNLRPVAAQVLERLPPGTGFAVFPDDEATSNLYAQARVRPPGFWMLTYPWYIDDSVQDRLIEGLSRVNTVVYFPGRELDGRLPERYMERVYATIEKEFPDSEELTWEQGRYFIRRRSTSR